MNGEKFNLPVADADAFSLSRIRGPIVDPAIVLRFLPEEVATQVVAVYEEYLAKAAELGAQTLQAQAQFHKQAAGIIGKAKR